MKQFLVFLFLLCTACVSAQDVIVKKDGSTVVCRIVELTSTEITYKKWSDLDGSNYVMNRADASTINYQNGKKVDLSEATNLYQPHNQNDGVQQYNDRALLQLDYATNNPLQKVKKLKTIGWIGGAVIVAGGGFLMIVANNQDSSSAYRNGLIAGGVTMGVGVAFTTTFLIIANNEKKKIDSIISYNPIFQHEFQLSNGSALTAGIDLINNHSKGERTLGFGVRYNF